jgi:methionine synthase I (cobalamin-dependent)
VTAANQPAYDADFLDTLSRRVMVGDGAMGTQLQAADAVESKTFGCTPSNLGTTAKRVGVDLRNELGVQTSIR